MNLFQPDPSVQTEKLYNKNLNFFRHKHPNIFNSVVDREINQFTIQFDRNCQKYDIYDGSAFMYEGDAESYASKEIALFKETYSEGKPLNNISPPLSGNYFIPRFFHKTIDKMITSADITPENYMGYKVPEFYPFMCFLGCGSGKHIEAFLKENEVLSAVIVEPEIELFCLSLYLVDWEEVWKPFSPDKGRSLQIVLGANLNETNFYNSTWNTLINYAPQFPIGTIFYVHRGEDKYWEIVKRLNKDIRVFLGLWGFYDDEVNQFNNSFNNISLGYSALPAKPQKFYDIPACVVGSGPSLDKRIEDLRKIKDKSIIFSCGTALGALYKHGIKPDFHVELESHYCAYEDCIKKIEDIDPEWLKDITIIGAVQLTPKAFFPFGRKVMFYKESMGLAEFFCPPEKRLHDTTPTCTNTGTSIAGYLNFTNILFFGMDFGFADKSDHHSKHTIYYDEDNSEAIRNAVKYADSALIKVKSISGEEIPTTDGYYTAMRRIENLLIRLWDESKGQQKIYNCSEGADIDGAPYLASENLFKGFEGQSPNKSGILMELKTRVTPPIPTDQMFEKIGVMQRVVEELCDKLLLILNKHTPTDLRTAYKFCSVTTLFLETNVQKSLGTMYYTFRGSIWHYLLALVSLALSIDKIPGRDPNVFINDWVDSYRYLLTELPKHFKESTSKSYPDLEDPWVNNGLEEESCPD